VRTTLTLWCAWGVSGGGGDGPAGYPMKDQWPMRAAAVSELALLRGVVVCVRVLLTNTLVTTQVNG
jgi:2,3-bisphosphoglycerate-independent phosphoglycerate mutase